MNRRYVAWALIILAAAAARLYLYSGFVFDDLFPYAYQAHALNAGTYDIRTDGYFGLNVAFILPQALFVMLFGDTAAGYFGWPFVAGLLTVILAMKIAYEHFGYRESIFAGIVVGFMPIFLIWSTIPLPDAATPLWWTLFFYFFLKAEAGGKRPGMLLFVAGLAAGVGDFNRLFTIGILAASPIFMFLKRKIDLRHLWILAGFGAGYLAGNTYYYLLSGDFFLRFHMTLQRTPYEMSADKSHFVRITDVEIMRGNILGYTRKLWGVAGLKYAGLAAYGALASAAALLYRKEWRPQDSLVLFWFVTIIFFMDVLLASITNLKDYFPYISGVFVPVGVFFAASLARLKAPECHEAMLRGSKLRRWSLAVAVAAGAVGVYYAGTLPGELLLPALADWLRSAPLDGAMFILAGVLSSAGAVTFALTFAATREQAGTVMRDLILGIFVISSLFIAKMEANDIGRRDTESKMTVREIDGSCGDNVYYMNHKVPLRLIPQMHFQTDFRRNIVHRQYESWNGDAGSRNVHFEFLPPEEGRLKGGDCILLLKPNLALFKEKGLQVDPQFSSFYRYPDYIKSPHENWSLLYEGPENLLYRVR